MLISDADAARVSRASKAFKAFAEAGKPVVTEREAILLFEAIKSEGAPATSLERVIGSKNGLSAVAQGVRVSLNEAFIINQVLPFLFYFSTPEAVALYDGTLLQRLIIAVVVPSTAWRNVINIYEVNRSLDGEKESEMFAWLALQVASLSDDRAKEAGDELSRALKQHSLLQLSWKNTRTLAYHIQQVQKMKDTGQAAQSTTTLVQNAGGRHDNDFADFRKIAIYPTPDEFSLKIAPFLRTAQEVAAADSSVRPAWHLDNQFRLLREDMLAELREDVQVAFGYKKGRRPPQVLYGLELSEISSGDDKRGEYCTFQVRFTSGLTIPKALDPKERHKYLKEKSNIIRHQSLGCLCLGNKIVGFTSIVRDVDGLAAEPPSVGLRFQDQGAMANAIRHFASRKKLRLILVDTPTFAYEPVLDRLQKLRYLPLQSELLMLDSQSDAESVPATEITEFEPSEEIQDFAKSLRAEANGTVIRCGKKDFPVDRAQIRALLYALETPLSVVQGPPGTGKSYIGALAAKKLLDTPNARLLVISYTNHALDQFLEDLIKIGIRKDEIIRLGSKSTDATSDLTLFAQMQSSNFRMTRDGWKTLQEIRTDVEDLQNDLDRALQLASQNVTASDILCYLEMDFEDDQSMRFWEAFQPPELEEGFRLQGRKSSPLGPNELLRNWTQGRPAGALESFLTPVTKPIWKMSHAERKVKAWKWESLVREERVQAVVSIVSRIDDIQRQTDIIKSEGKRQLVRSKRVLGCTTTAAARDSHLTKAFEPTCVLVEEAGEIMESHITTALGAGTKQLILIGDHKQLRPKCNNYALSVEKGDGFDLNRSLFERLILQGHHYETLRLQHRMVPQVSQIVRELTYPDLQDSSKTSQRPALKGICQRVSFINHSHPESTFAQIGDARDAGSSGSKRNSFEAEMVLKTVHYLGQQGYGTNDIVVLTPYLGQLSLLREMLQRDKDTILSDMDSAELVKANLLTNAAARVNRGRIRLSTIDNYQGEESDIVVVSMTRSNDNGEIGFMKAPERLNVLVSRARNCLIMIGNMETFIRSRQGKQCWRPFFQVMKANNFLHDGLRVRCERHPETNALLSNPQDFSVNCPEGGCNKICNAPFNCGLHFCARRCHLVTDHSKMPCSEPVQITCERNHTYTATCGNREQPCEDCHQEEEDMRRRMERNLLLEKCRLERQAKYRESLQKIKDEINYHTRFIEDAKNAEQEQKTLKEEQTKLENLRDKKERKEAMDKAEERAQQFKKNVKPKRIPLEGSAQGDWQRQRQEEGAKSEEIDTLMDMIGLDNVKRTFLDIKGTVDTALRQGISLGKERWGVTLLGNPGTGKTTVARLYAKFLTKMGVLSGGHFEETTGSKLASKGVQGCQELLDKVAGNGGGVIFIDEAYQLSSGNHKEGKAVLDFLLAEVENLRSQICFVLAGYAREMESFFAHNPGFPSRFPLELQFADYSDTELLDILEYQVNSKYGYRMQAEDGLRGLYCRIVTKRLGRGRGKEGFGNARAVENTLSRIYRRQAKRLQHDRREGAHPDDLLLTKEDLIGQRPSNALQNSAYWIKLQELIGLDSVKESVKALVDTIEANYERELNEQPVIEYNLNRVFLGNPGTGKTTVAKIYGQILVDLGMISNGEVVLKNPSDFVGSALGQSEAQTKGLLANTVGKVLVIDEAYGLYGGSAGDPYKTAVVDTIVATVHSTPGDDRCVLLLGYRDQMEEMFQNVNPGLARRFPIASAFEFDDFNQEQISKIVELKIKQQGFGLTATAKDVMLGMLDRARNRPNFGNAGEVDILLNDAKARHQKHLTAGKTKRTTTLEALDFDPNYKRLDRSGTNIAMLFKDTVGCERIIATLKGYQDTVHRMTRLGLDPKETIPFNFLFRGPPGTGKTITARKMGKIFYDAGFLSDASVLDCSASDIIGQYVGQTGPKVRSMLDKALGRVLLIDEAYRLAEGHYAKEALDEIVYACTEERYEKRLIIILAGYEDDINRLLNVNPGMTSRFPEVFDFHGLGPMECIDLMTRKLLQKKTSLEQPGKGTLNVSCLKPTTGTFEFQLRSRFEQLSKQKSWASARDVETLTKSIFDQALRSASDPTNIEVNQTIILDILDAMAAERDSRGKCSSTLADGLKLVLNEPQIAEQRPPSPKRQKITTITTSEQQSPPEEHSPDEPADKPKQHRKKAVRDAGVTDEVWDQLQEDIRQEEERERQYQEKLKRKNEEMDEESRARILEELIEEEERRRKEAEMKKRLEMMGKCPVGYEWIRQASGWRCAGGSHYIGEDEASKMSG